VAIDPDKVVFFVLLFGLYIDELFTNRTTRMRLRWGEIILGLVRPPGIQAAVVFTLRALY